MQLRQAVAFNHARYCGLYLFSLPEGKEVRYAVLLNVAYAGKYYMPTVYCEAMYNHSISALLKGEWVEVVK